MRVPVAPPPEFSPVDLPSEAVATAGAVWSWIVAGVAGLVMALGFGAWLLTRDKGRSPQRPDQAVAATGEKQKRPDQPVAQQSEDKAPTSEKQKRPDQPAQPPVDKTPDSAFPPPPEAGNAPKLWHTDVVEIKHDPTSIEFAVGLLPGKAAVTGKKATLWFTIGTPTTIPSIRSSLERDLKEDKNRFFLNFYGPGFITVPCRDARRTGANKERWHATVNFGTMNLKEETLDIRGSTFKTTALPMSFVFWDDEFNLSNELKFFVNTKTGKVVKILSEPDNPQLPGKNSPRVTYSETRDTNVKVTDIYVDTAAPLKSKPAKLVTAFPSGTKTLNIMIEFDVNPPRQLDVKVEVQSSKGRVDTTPKDKGPVATSMYIEHNRTLCLFVVPSAGLFADGPYQASVVINGKEYAVLNWSVGD